MNKNIMQRMIKKNPSQKISFLDCVKIYFYITLFIILPLVTTFNLKTVAAQSIAGQVKVSCLSVQFTQDHAVIEVSAVADKPHEQWFDIAFISANPSDGGGFRISGSEGGISSDNTTLNAKFYFSYERLLTASDGNRAATFYPFIDLRFDKKYDDLGYPLEYTTFAIPCSFKVQNWPGDGNSSIQQNSGTTNSLNNQCVLLNSFNYSRCCSASATSNDPEKMKRCNEKRCEIIPNDPSCIQISGPTGGTQSSAPFGFIAGERDPTDSSSPQAGSIELSSCSKIQFKSALDILIWLKCVIIVAIIPLIFAIALVVFLWGVFKFMSASDVKSKQEGQKVIWWGILGLFVMVSVWGIIKILGTTLGIESAVPMLQTEYLTPNKPK